MKIISSCSLSLTIRIFRDLFLQLSVIYWMKAGTGVRSVWGSFWLGNGAVIKRGEGTNPLCCCRWCSCKAGHCGRAPQVRPAWRDAPSSTPSLAPELLCWEPPAGFWMGKEMKKRLALSHTSLGRLWKRYWASANTACAHIHSKRKWQKQFH